MEIYNDTYCVYVHINKINGKKYVGQTIHGKHPKKRWVNGLGYQSQKYFWRAIQKYGWDNFDHHVVASNLTKVEADNFEKLLIKKLNTTDRNCGYNISFGGDGSPGIRQTEEQIQKRNETMRKYLDDPVYRQKMRDVANKKEVWQFTANGELVMSYPSSKEAERQTGVLSSGICACALRKVPSAGGYIWTYAGDIDDIQQRVAVYTNTKLRLEPIVQLTLDCKFIAEWESAAEAGRQIGINYKNINLVCRNKRKQAGGFRWMYLSDYLELYQHAC